MVIKTRSQPAKPKVMPFRGLIECKNHPRHSGILYPANSRCGWHQAGQHSVETRIAAIEAQLGSNSYPEEGDVIKQEGETPREATWGETEGVQC